MSCRLLCSLMSSYWKGSLQKEAVIADPSSMRDACHYEPSLYDVALHESPSTSVVRVCDWCTEGHGFDSHRGLKFFLFHAQYILNRYLSKRTFPNIKFKWALPLTSKFFNDFPSWYNMCTFSRSGCRSLRTVFSLPDCSNYLPSLNVSSQYLIVSAVFWKLTGCSGCSLDDGTKFMSCLNTNSCATKDCPAVERWNWECVIESFANDKQYGTWKWIRQTQWRGSGEDIGNAA